MRGQHQEQRRKQKRRRPKHSQAKNVSVASLLFLFAVVALAVALPLFLFLSISSNMDSSQTHHDHVSVAGVVDSSSRMSSKQRQQGGGAGSIRGEKTESQKLDSPTNEVTGFLSSYLTQLHDRLIKTGNTGAALDIWESFHNLTVETLYPWDQKYLANMPQRREDGSIFLSLASYRDENCLATLQGAYGNAKNPHKLFVGLVQQNCETHCRSGVLEGGIIQDVGPDDDCHALFCDTPLGRIHCEAGRVRVLHVQESESLGPYMARYFASKLWYGETWYMQIDSHMSFAKDWDEQTVEMLHKAPSPKPVISHYPPDADTDFERAKTRPAPRICGPIFATSGIEANIVRLEGSGVYDKEHLDTPRFAPFVAAGYFAAHSGIFSEVPFDPFLPWIFMGEEIIMSARMWTSGYDIFSPTHSVLGHIYVRRHKPKFWESVGRVFSKPGIHNPLQQLVLDRVKTQLLYSESAPDKLKTGTLLTALEKYTMGTRRTIEEYLKMVGLDPKTKTVTHTSWCEQGQPPPQFQHLKKLYQSKNK